MKLYNEQCKKHFRSQGFVHTGKSHWRMVNDDLYQSFSLHQGRAGGRYRSYQVHFGITPLCFGIERDFVRRGLLDDFSSHVFFGCSHYSWFYEPKSEESILSHVEEAITFINDFLIPYFSRGSDSAAALIENRIIYRRTIERAGDAVNEEDFWGGRSEFCMALKSGNFKMAERYLSQNIAGIQKDLGCDNFQGSIERCEEILADLTFLCKYISARDMSFISSFIETNERKSRIALGLEPDG
jgi:hypothetical protein